MDRLYRPGCNHYTNKSYTLYCFHYNTSLQLLASFSANSKFNIPSPCQGLLIINSKTSRKCKHVGSRHSPEKWAIGKKYLLFLGSDPVQTFHHVNNRLFESSFPKFKEIINLKGTTVTSCKIQFLQALFGSFNRNMVIKIRGMFWNQFGFHKCYILKQQIVMELTTFITVRLWLTCMC